MNIFCYCFFYLFCVVRQVDPTYCVAPAVGEGGVAGAYTKGLKSLTTLVPHAEDAVLPHSQQYSFISSCFFLTHRALHLGMQVRPPAQHFLHSHWWRRAARNGQKE